MDCQRLDVFLDASVSDDEKSIYRIDDITLVLIHVIGQKNALDDYLQNSFPPILATTKILSADVIPSTLVVVLDGDVVSTQNYITMPPSLWQATLTLPSAVDILAYLTALYGDNSLVPQVFLHSPSYYHRAWQVEKHLQSMDLMVRVNPPIKEAVYKKQDSLDYLAARQCQLSPLWERAVWRWLGAQTENKTAQAAVLLAQCGYTRMKIIDFILEYQTASDDDKINGKLAYEHSYHCFGVQFVLVIYGQSQASELHKDAIAVHHEAILTHIKNQIASDELKGLFLLGFDLSQKDNNGNHQVFMDVYEKRIKTPVKKAGAE